MLYERISVEQEGGWEKRAHFIIKVKKFFFFNNFIETIV